MSDAGRLLSSIKTVTISALLMGDERAVALQSKIRGVEQKWTIVQVSACEVINERELPRFAFMDRVQVIDERYWRFPEVDDAVAMAYIALRPYDSADHKYRNIVQSLIGDELFNTYYNGHTLRLSDRHVRNIIRQLNAVVSQPS